MDVCPYEGGSDHSRFLAQNVPALLTWHFTDYTYHSSVDTLNMVQRPGDGECEHYHHGHRSVIANATDGTRPWPWRSWAP